MGELPRTVCHVIHSLQDGGAEHVLVDFATATAAHGLRTVVVALVGDTGTRHGCALKAAGAQVYSLHLPNRWDPRGPLRCRDVLRQVRPDIVHTHLKHADLAGGLAAHTLRIPTVSTLHVIEDAPTVVGRVKRGLAAAVRSRARCTIAVSRAQRQWYLQTFSRHPGHVVTMPNGVVAGAPITTAATSQLRGELGAGRDDVLAVMVSVLRPGKGHADLVRAAELLPETSRVRLAIVGDGESRAVVEGLVAKSPARDRLRLVGYRDDVPTLLQAADLVIHPTHADALPTALIHGLAAGVPVLATDVGGVPDIVTPDVGVLVPPREPEQLAEALERLARDPLMRARMGRAGRRRFESQFSAQVWADRLLALYVKVLSGSPV